MLAVNNKYVDEQLCIHILLVERVTKLNSSRLSYVDKVCGIKNAINNINASPIQNRGILRT